MQKQLSLAWAEIAKLKEENFLMKRAIKQAIAYMPITVPDEISLTVPDEEVESWRERSEKFKKLRSMLVKLVKELCAIHGAALHQDEILRVFRSRYPTLWSQLGSETIQRRLRELRSEGYLTSPQQGHFFIGERLVKELGHEDIRRKV